MACARPGSPSDDRDPPPRRDPRRRLRRRLAPDGRGWPGGPRVDDQHYLADFQNQRYPALSDDRAGKYGGICLFTDNAHFPSGMAVMILDEAGAFLRFAEVDEPDA